MGNTLIRVKISERRDAFIPKKERFSWVYAFFSPGKPDVMKRLQTKFWNDYLMPEFMAGFRLYDDDAQSIEAAISRFEQEELGRTRQTFVDFCPGFSMICIAGSSEQGVAPIHLFQYGNSGCVFGEDNEKGLVNNCSGHYPAVVGMDINVSGPDAFIHFDTYEALHGIASLNELDNLDVNFLEQPMFDLHSLNPEDINDYMKNLIEDGYMAEAMALRSQLNSSYDLALLQYLNDLNELLIDVKADGPLKYKTQWDGIKADHPMYINGNASQDVFTKGSRLFQELQKLMAIPARPAPVRGTQSRPSAGYGRNVPGTATTPVVPALPKIDQDYETAMQAMQTGNYMMAASVLKAIKQAMTTTNPTTFTMSDLNNQLMQAEEALHIDEVKTALNANDPKKANTLYKQYQLNDPVLKSQIDTTLQNSPKGDSFWGKYKYFVLGGVGLITLFLIVLTVIIPVLRENAVPVAPQGYAETEQTDTKADAEPRPVVPENPTPNTPVTPKPTTSGSATAPVRSGSGAATSKPAADNGPVNTTMSFESALQQIANGNKQYIDYALNMCTDDAKVFVHASDDSYMEHGSMSSFLRQVSMKKSLGYEIEQVVREGNKINQLILK